MPRPYGDDLIEKDFNILSHISLKEEKEVQDKDEDEDEGADEEEEYMTVE